MHFCLRLGLRKGRHKLSTESFTNMHNSGPVIPGYTALNWKCRSKKSSRKSAGEVAGSR